MKNIYLLSLLLLSLTWNSFSQEITETNSDVIYKKALESYKEQNFVTSLSLTERGLELAPEYHDIRILKVRNLWALQKYRQADKDLEYLISYAQNYPELKPLLIQRSNYFESTLENLAYIASLENMYPEDNYVQIRKVQLLIKNEQKSEARKLALALIIKPGISANNRYALHSILKETVTNEIGLNYQIVDFSDDYNKEHPWQTISGEYQHNFNRTAVIGRITYSDRGFKNGYIYELEAYPVINDKFYAFTNIGVSNGTLFPDVRSSLSLYYNFARIFEIEAGSRLLTYSQNTYFTGILGLTAYQGKFYINARSFLGPQRKEQLIQNYQFNLRYFLKNADNYLFFRGGSGISPDERTIFTQVHENPNLKAYYVNIGINKTLGIHHQFQLSTGLLFEQIDNSRDGTQLMGNIGYKYKF